MSGTGAGMSGIGSGTGNKMNSIGGSQDMYNNQQIRSGYPSNQAN